MPEESDMQRTLTAEFPAWSVNFDGSDWGLRTTISADWVKLTDGFYFNETVIDLSGYALKKKSFFPYSSFEQRGGTVSATIAAGTLTSQPYVFDGTIITSAPMNQSELLSSLIVSPGFIQLSGVGAFGLRQNRDQILHGEQKIYTLDSTLSVAGVSNYQKLVSRELFSSLEPTAADKLYCYRIVGVSAGRNEATEANLPATRVLMPGNITSEPQLEYMMRLKRSYELANQV
uniref:Uncharacterized protein n=1 Tax=uncultured prokaryote TaxID=198431 RepID=A0A0H5QPD0_9ZZZZ|nr:hypothetical protein [uncultured prokaryote]